LQVPRLVHIEIRPKFAELDLDLHVELSSNKGQLSDNKPDLRR